MARLLKRVVGHPRRGPDDRSVLLWHGGAQAIYDLDLERSTEFVPLKGYYELFERYRGARGQSSVKIDEPRKHQRRFSIFEGNLEARTEDQRVIASHPFDRTEDELDLYPTFDRSGETLWMGFCANAPDDYTVYAVEVATGRTFTTLLGNRDRVWLRPDWGEDRTVWVYHCDGQYTGHGVCKHTLGAEYERGPWHYLDTDDFKGPEASRWHTPDIAPLHCKDGRWVLVSDYHLWVYLAGTGELLRGPRVGEGQVEFGENECPSWEWSSRDRVAIQWEMYLTVHDPESLETLGVIPNPGATQAYVAPIFLADNRIAIATSGGCELWQL